MKTTLFGIKNCDTVKKARVWLDKNNIDYQFHDFREDGLTKSDLQGWIKASGWETLLNKRSTTFRNLDDKNKNSLDRSRAMALILEHPTLIKRPVLVTRNNVEVGFKADNYKQIFKG